jgi:hypothetical protein
MNSVIKTFRLLKREQPDRSKVERLFAKKDDEELLAAIANPEHSETARGILRDIAAQRGLEHAIEHGWAQTEASMYVAPFGRQPSTEEVLAAPNRRRLVYRSLQAIMVVCVAAGLFLFLSPGPYREWVQHGVDAGTVDSALIARFRGLTNPPGDRKIYQYLHGLNLFARDLRQNLADFLVQDGLIDPDVVQEYERTEGAQRDAANREIVDSFNAMSKSSAELSDYLYATKARAYEVTIKGFDKRFEDGAAAGVMEAPADQPYVEAFVELSQPEVDFINANGGDNAVAFDHFEEFSGFEPEGPRSPASEPIGMALLVVGPALWLFGGIFSWLQPYRILLLRPFQSRKVSGPLKRFIQKNLSFHGHVITLADKYVKESLLNYVFFWIPRSVPDIFVLALFFIPAIRQFKRWIRVSSAHSYGFLKKRLARRFTMNMFWQNAWTKLLKVKCSDTWWKQSVDLLMYSCHLIVVDLSWVKVGTEWELGKIDRRDLERKTVFVVGEDAADYAREVVHRFWPSEEAPPPLYVYRKSGALLEREAFEREVARIISASHLWHGVQAEGV